MSVRVTATYGLSIFCSYPWLYRISYAEATEIKCFQINRYHNKTSNLEALEKVWKNKILTSLRYLKLWFSKMTTTGLTHTDIYPIKLFQYFRHLLITKLWEILLASKEIPAQSKFLAFSAGTQQTIMPNPDKTFWRHMHQKPSYEVPPEIVSSFHCPLFR